jgi:hypothetical protein
VKSSFYSLIPLLPLSCKSIQYLCSQSRILAGWRLETRLNSIPLLPSSYPGRLASRNSTQFNTSAPKLVSWQAGVSKLDSIQYILSQAPILAGCRLETRLNSIPLLPSSYPGRLASRNSTQFNTSAPKLVSWQAGVSKLDSTALLFWQKLPSNHFARIPRKTQPLLLRRGIYWSIA